MSDGKMEDGGWEDRLRGWKAGRMDDERIGGWTKGGWKEGWEDG